MITIAILGTVCFIIIIAVEFIPYIYKLSMIGKVRIYKFEDGFAVKQFGYSKCYQIRYRYDSSYRYDWYWITKEKQPTCDPIPLSQIEAEELAQSLYNDYLETKKKEKSIKSAKLFKKL